MPESYENRISRHHAMTYIDFFPTSGMKTLSVV